MVITPEQSDQIKKQLISQIEQSEIPNKKQVKEQISKFNSEQLEQFLKQNNIQFEGEQLQQSSEGNSETSTPKCIFCSIINNETPSYKIAENKKAIAILEINPLSKGHSIIIPNEHTTIEKIPKTALSLAQKTAKKIKTKLKSEDVKIETNSIQGHAIINIIPFYKDQQPEKKQASEQELQNLQSILETKKRSPRGTKSESKVKITKQSLKGLQKLSFRVP